MEETNAAVSEKIQNYLDDAMKGYEAAANGFASEFKVINARDILFRIISGKLPEMLEAYAECLNEAALMRGRGASLGSKEYQEMERLIQMCEHWIADRVLASNGWKSTSVTMYHKLKNG